VGSHSYFYIFSTSELRTLAVSGPTAIDDRRFPSWPRRHGVTENSGKAHLPQRPPRPRRPRRPQSKRSRSIQGV